MQVAALSLFFSSAAHGSLQLSLHTNSALVRTNSTVDSALGTLSLSFPVSSFFSAEVVGAFSPDAQTFDFSCVHSNLAYLFLWVDNHLVCAHGANNNSANGAMDTLNLTLRSKRSSLPLVAQLYSTASAAPGSLATLELRWSAPAGSGAPFAPLPAALLAPALPGPELERRALQRGMMAGWGGWLHRDILSTVLLPDSAVVTAQVCHLPTGACLSGAQIDGNGGDPHMPPVRVGSHALDHGYSQFFVSFLLLNVSLEVAGGPGGGVDILVTPQPGLADPAEFAVAFSGRFAWGRRGAVAEQPGGLVFAGVGLPHVALFATAPPLSPPSRCPPVYAPGLPGGLPCAQDRDCASEACSCNWSGCVGVCAAAAPLARFAAPLGDGAVGLTSKAGGGVAGVRARIAAAAATVSVANARFGAQLAGTTDAATAALGWRNVWAPSEQGPFMPVNFGFSWVAPSPFSYDFAYVLFAWDNIFASYTAGVLGAKAAAYSNLIAIIKSKTNAGFVPNWAAGGSKSSQAEPAVGGRVLLELYRRFNDTWLVELLVDDLLDWHEWQWTQRRVVAPGSACCGEPGFITVGGSAPCAAPATDCVGAFKGESGLDQSPKWDCVGAAPDGSGGNCGGMAVNGSAVLQMGETQSTALFVADADAVAALCDAVERPAAAATARARAGAMRAQLAKLWDPLQGAFADLYVHSGAFSTRITPTIFYPLLGGAASEAQALALLGHLYNKSEFCVSAAPAGSNPDRCYWGLPSVSAADPAFMQPQGYVYWRGEAWAPMALLTYWALREAAHVPQVAQAAADLAAQKNEQLLDMWNRNRHICENYSPFAPWSNLSPGNNGGRNKSNAECTGWEFYTWGALNGIPALLEAQAAM